MSTKATARVTLSIDVPIERPWDGDTRLITVRQQAKDDAQRLVRKLLESHGIRLVGEAKVSAIVVDE